MPLVGTAPFDPARARGARKVVMAYDAQHVPEVTRT